MSFVILCVAGARPNFMKLAPLLRVLEKSPDFSPLLVHTGQHYDHKMSGQFFEDLAMTAPAYSLEVGSGSHAQQTAEIMKRFEPVVLETKPGAVLVVGDVNSTMACAIVATKLGVPVVHVEAGLRSFDRSMPEEINRVLTDSISDLYLVTEPSGRENLVREGVAPERIHLVGNLMIDSLRHTLRNAGAATTSSPAPVEPPFGLVTLHRPANVDDTSHLKEILEALAAVSADIPLLFPVHPRTRPRLQEVLSALQGQIQLLEPLGYVEFLNLMARSAVVFTDSGGIQEETTALGIPCITLRENTERPITVEQGTNILAGTSREKILSAWESVRKEPKNGSIPQYWDGEAAPRCLAALEAHFLGRVKSTTGDV